MPNQQLSERHKPEPQNLNGFSIGNFAVEHPAGSDLLPPSIFMKMLCIERKRAERSGRKLVLMLLDSPTLLEQGAESFAARRILHALERATRETDIRGWQREGSVLGVVFTEIPAGSSVVPLLSAKVNRALRDDLTLEQTAQIQLSFHLFPDETGATDPRLDTSSTLHPDLLGEIESRRVPFLIKRVVDIVGSLMALILLTPLLLLISTMVKATSRGPILFRQRRLGQFGNSFTFLKFRSMYAEADHTIHEAYMKRFISNQTDPTDGGAGPKVYKIQADPRVTPVGRFLRRSSLDELPQFLNVLAGKMSLVGPRPPLPYEFESYEAWHRRRLLAKPGITGFWQVEGRSRVKFDEMVRMDLEYARSWSLLLDFKILLQTPRAVLGGNGAH
ncbi:MAG: sugar transferase [Terriglobia bacterium]